MIDIKELARLLDERFPRLDANGKLFIKQDSEWRRVYSDPDRPDTLAINGLTGLIDFLRVDPPKEKVFISVSSINRVEIISQLTGEANERSTYAVATPLQLDQFRFGNQYSVEEAIIRLNTLFVQTAELTELLTLISRVTVDNERKLLDNGVSQIASVKQGVKGSLTETEVIKNRFNLKPIRIFHEVDQPESPFLLRLSERNGSVAVALFEADGGAWQIQAKNNIVRWLGDQSTGLQIIG